MEMGRDLKVDSGSAGILRKLRRRSFEKNSESPRIGKVIQKTQSLGSQLLDNIEGLTDVGYEMESASVLSKASSNNNGLPCYSFSLDDAGEISNHISLRIQNQSPTPNTVSRAQSTAREKEHRDEDEERRLYVEPTLPIYLKFQDVKYKVGAAKGVKSSVPSCILEGITGSVQPGEVLALMGPSGGGKTTLLNLLSGRAKLNSGSITYNDQPYTKSLKHRIGYVMQDDLLFPHLTVKETLTYAALLRLPISLTKSQKKERAMHVIHELGLERCQDTVIGGKFVRGVSGGERKRVCIGNEILLNPSLLFLDEPTSGLDSTAAFRILQMLQIIAEAGKTVVTTIHQPSSRIFSKFDKLILLGRGSSLYFGNASEAMMYFNSIGCAPLIAMNPAEFLIDLANGNTNDKSLPTKWEDGGPSVHEFLVLANQDRLSKMEYKSHQNSVLLLHHGEQQMQGRSYSKEAKATWWEQFSILFHRGLKERRHEYLSWMRIIQVISTAIIVGLLWWHSNASSAKQLHDQAGLLFFISVFWAFFPLFTAVFTFPQERAIVAKERSVEMYKLSSYFLARNISDLPLDLLLPVVFLVIVYMMVGLNRTFAAFFETMLTIFLSIVAAQGLGLSIGAAFIDIKKATTFASVIVMTFMLSGGFFIQKVPSVISWVRYISFNYHTYRLLLKIQYGCLGSDSGMNTAGYEPCESPFIKELRLDSWEMEVGAMMIMIIGYRLLAYLLLRTIKLRTMI